MAKRHLRLVTPATVNRTVTPRRRRNGDLRTREYLTESEVERLMKAATGNRHGHRDVTMILVAYRHGLRVSELVDLRWDQVDFRTATLHVRRVKQGTPSTHPIIRDELRALRRLQREQEPKSPFVFTSERGAPFTTAGFARMVDRAGADAKLAFKAHPHMLRHACGYALANAHGFGMATRPFGKLWEGHFPERSRAMLRYKLRRFAEGADMPAIDLSYIEITMQLNEARDAT